MILHSTLATVLLLPYISTHLLNQTTPNKIKRTTFNDQIYSHGDAKAVLFYMENPRPVEVPELQTAASNQGLRNFYPAPPKPLALVSVQQPIQVFEQDNPKQVAEQQVLYEFQQTPTNAVSNVNVKQIFQPSNVDITTPSSNIQGQATDQFPATQPIASGYITSPNFQTQQHKSFAPQAAGLVGFNNPSSSATIVSPVHHSIYTNHGLGSAQSFNSYQNPFSSDTQQQFQSTNKAPGKYIYLNGKIVYNPVHIIPQSKLTPNSVYHKGVYHNQQKLPLINNNFKLNPMLPQQTQQVQSGTNRDNYAGNHRPTLNKQPSEMLTPPAYLPPITKKNTGFRAPKKLHPIDKPSHPIQEEVEDKEEEEDQEEEERPEREEAGDKEEVEEDEEDAASENEEEERENPESYAEDETYGYERFPFEEDDEDHYFKPTKYRKNRDHDEEHHEDDHDDHEEQPSSRYHQSSKRRHRNPQKYDDSFGFHEGYSSNSKFKYAKKNGKNVKADKPNGKFKKVKYSRMGQGKPKVENIEGKFSENVPVTHKAKIYKERWYVSKDIEGNMGRKHKAIK